MINWDVLEISCSTATPATWQRAWPGTSGNRESDTRGGDPTHPMARGKIDRCPRSMKNVVQIEAILDLEMASECCGGWIDMRSRGL